MANVTPWGLPQNLYPNLFPTQGIKKTAFLFNKYQSLFVIDNATSKISIQGGLLNNQATWSELLQLWQDLDNWAQANPADVTPKIQRLSDMLIRLRKASSTDAVYDAYELILFFNIALTPDYFSPLIFSESVYSTYIMLAKDYTYEMLYTRVQNDRQRAVNPNAPIVTPQQVYPNYVPPPTTGGTTPSAPGTPVTPLGADTKSTAWAVFMLVAILVLLILILR